MAKLGANMDMGLEELAHETSSDKRRELLNRVTGMFLDGVSSRSNRESTLYTDVVLQVLDELGVSDRADFSNSISDEAGVPKGVVCRLAKDEIEVAAPILSNSPVLDETDLVDIASTAPQEHLRAISVRTSLSESVTDTLIRRGDTEVVRSVSGNTGARFSADGLTVLTQRSAEDVTVRRNILTRPDLREQLVEKVLPIVSPEYADQLREMIAKVDDGTVDFVIERAEQVVRRDKLYEARQRLETRAIINELRSNARHIDDVLVDYLAQGRVADVATILSKIADVPEAIVNNVIFKANNEPIAILLRAAGASAKGFKALQDMRGHKLKFPISHHQRGMQEFSRLDEQTAKRSLRFVKIRSAVA